MEAALFNDANLVRIQTFAVFFQRLVDAIMEILIDMRAGFYNRL